MILLLGVFMSAPYFFVLGATVYLAIKRGGFVYVGVFLLLLQRPYVLTFGYSLMILLVVFGVRRSNHRQTNSPRPQQTRLQRSSARA
jgi:membrane protein implicated in regulation of membrane protease activity